MNATREPIFKALFARGSAIRWSGPTTGLANAWMTADRRLVTPDQIGVEQQPAFFQAEGHETHARVAKMPVKRTLSAAWVIYLSAVASPDPTSPVLNAVMDGVECALAPDDPVNDVCTLGGLVAHAWIEGDVFRDPGDIDGQAMIVVPIRILLP